MDYDDSDIYENPDLAVLRAALATAGEFRKQRDEAQALARNLFYGDLHNRPEDRPSFTDLYPWLREGDNVG